MWDARYAEPGFAYGTSPNDFLVEVAPRYVAAGAEVLCLAEGEGRNAVYLAARGARVTGVDGSAVGLAKATALAAERGVTITTVVADLAGYDLGVARWDAIVSIWCHTPAPLRERLHGAVAAALRPGGVFLLEAYTPAQVTLGTGGPKDPSMTMTLAGLRAELVGLDVELGRELRRPVHEGRFHDGDSAVVQLVARRPA